jgi:hypothetical protein
MRRKENWNRCNERKEGVQPPETKKLAKNEKKIKRKGLTYRRREEKETGVVETISNLLL